MPRTRLSSPISSVSDESEREEQEASWSDPEAPSSRSPRLLVFAPRDLLRAPKLGRSLLPPLGPAVLVGHARFGGGAVRDTRDGRELAVGECPSSFGEGFGEWESALSDEPDATGAVSVFQESRMMGGPSSAEKSDSGRS